MKGTAMLLPERIREDIANQLIKVIIPVTVGSIVFMATFTYLLAPDRLSRLVPSLVALVVAIPPWILAKKGKPLIGAYFIIAGMIAVILTGMYANGGVHAPVFYATLVNVILVVCLYGLLNTLLYSVVMVAVGVCFVLMEQQQLLPPWIMPSSTFILAMFIVLLGVSLFFSAIPVKLLQKALQEKEAFAKQIDRLATVVEQAAEDVVITDTQGIIEYVNPSFEKLTGYSKAEVLGQTPRILKSGKHDQLFYARIWDRINKGNIWQGRLWNKMKDGRIILQDGSIAPIFDASQKLTGYVSVRKDITEQSKTEERLQQSQKMEAIGTLAGGIAHDFNNILSGMIGYAELALYDVNNMPSTKEKLEHVLEAGQRATDLVKQILSFSRSQQKEAIPVSPLTIINEALKLLRSTLPANIEIKQYLNSESHILADPTNIHQVIMNLCTNAGHAMRKTGGVLSVRINDVHLDDRNVSQYEGMAPGNFLKISVEDTGHGIPEDIQSKIFDPFFTTKGLGEGTGMGLSAVHGIVKELGGAITLYSEVNKGTVFHVFIPIIARLPDTERIGEQEPLVGGTERILFVDDEKIQIELAKESLGRLGYQVTAFSSSLAALEHFQDNIESYNLIITDMTMPEMTGDVLAKRIKLIRPDIPVIMCTGFSEIIDEKKAKAININAFIYKPVVARELSQTIRTVLDSKNTEISS
jgi:PAS domain S-box-containing protein